ncbi:CG2 omega domain protein [Vibrio sp. E150_011]
MKQLLLIPITFFFSLSMAHADLTIKSDRMEISEDCRQVKGDVMTLKSEDCDDSSNGSSKDKGNGMSKGNNRSIHGDDNPGKGHDKSKNKTNKKDE